MDAQYIKTVATQGYAEFKDKGSRFLTYVFPIKDVEGFKEKLAEIKKEHPKATHHCFAYRLGIDGNTYRVSDDGEPSGTAGRPILGQIDSNGLTNTLIIVVRYYGGTLLGVPGLIHAYKTSASLVLQVTPAVQQPVKVNYWVEVDYTRLNQVMVIVKQTESDVLKNETNLFCRMLVAIPKNRLEEVLFRLQDMPVNDLQPEKK